MVLDDYIYIIAILVGACVMILMIPFLFQVMTMDFPTEKWCQNFNESDYPEINSSYEAHTHYCFKNETGWHLNTSQPLILENAIS